MLTVCPVLCLSTGGERGSGLREARRLLELGEADAAIVLTGDVVPPDARIEAEFLS